MRSSSGQARSRLRPLDYVFLARPPSLVPLWVFQFAGAWAAARAHGTPFPPFGAPPAVLLGALSMTLLLSGCFVLNQIFDVESDRANRKLFYLADGLISMRAAWLELGVLWAAAAATALFLPASFRWVLVVSFILSVTYSAPPVRAKARTPLDLLWNGLGFGLAGYAAGWTSASALAPGWWWAGVSYGLSVAGVIASTTIPDIQGDMAAGLRTTGAVLGARRTSALTMALLLAGAAVGWLSRDVLGLFGPLLALPLMIRAHRSLTRPDRVMADQVAVAVFAVIAGVRVPLLLLLLGAVYFGTRAYYRARFGMAFPGRGTP
ncbi:MAG: UbiA family prenyltransferase [Candidatus Eisenbacteria bacterium]